MTEARGLVVGVDLGGTKTAAAVVAADGGCGPVLTVPTPARLGPEAVLDAVAALVRAAVEQAGDGSTGRSGPDGGSVVAAVGVGAAGVIDAARGVVVSATDTFLDWPGTDLAGGLRRRLTGTAGAEAAAPGPPLVVVENDVDAYAAGELWRGAAAGAGSLLLVAVGTGVGGAVVLDGRTVRGAHHVAGELGHVPVPGAEGLRCPCGREGHLEAISAGPAIHRRYLALGGDPASPDARAVATRAELGEPLAERVVRDAAVALGRAVAGVVTVLDPEMVVVGGGVAGSGSLWWSTLRETVSAEVVDALAGLPVHAAALGPSAAILGAGLRAWRALDEGSER